MRTNSGPGSTPSGIARGLRIVEHDEVDVAGIVEFARAVLAEREHDQPAMGLDVVGVRRRASAGPRRAARRSRKRSAAATAASAKRVSASVVATTSQTPPMSASAISSAASRLARRSARIASRLVVEARAVDLADERVERRLRRGGDEARRARGILGRSASTDRANDRRGRAAGRAGLRRGEFARGANSGARSRPSSLRRAAAGEAQRGAATRRA